MEYVVMIKHVMIIYLHSGKSHNSACEIITHFLFLSLISCSCIRKAKAELCEHMI